MGTCNMKTIQLIEKRIDLKKLHWVPMYVIMGKLQYFLFRLCQLDVIFFIFHKLLLNQENTMGLTICILLYITGCDLSKLCIILFLCMPVTQDMRKP